MSFGPYYGDPSRDTVRCQCPAGHQWEVTALAYHGYGKDACPYCLYGTPGQVIPVGSGGRVGYLPIQGASYSSSPSFSHALKKMRWDEMRMMKPESPGDWLDKEINKVRRLAFAA